MYFETEIGKSDTKEIINSPYINWDYFKNSSILVTGATGLIGSQIINALVFANKTLNLNVKIFALVRNKDKANKIFSGEKSINYIIQDIIEPVNIAEKIDFIIHTANSTASKDFVDNPVETINSIVEGTRNILEFSKNKVKNVVYLSSMEVFGKTDFEREEPLKEEDYGYIDIAQVRSSYPESKRLAEMMCVAYAKEYNVPVMVARLVQTIGAGVSYFDNRVFAQFARNVVEKQDIILKTTGKSARSYCYVTDAVISLFVLLERGINGEFYNIANTKTNCSVKEMAQILCNKYSSTKLRIELDEGVYPPVSKLYVDTTKLEKLDWQAKVGLAEMYDRLIKSFGERNEK